MAHIKENVQNLLQSSTVTVLCCPSSLQDLRELQLREELDWMNVGNGDVSKKSRKWVW